MVMRRALVIPVIRYIPWHCISMLFIHTNAHMGRARCMGVSIDDCTMVTEDASHMDHRTFFYFYGWC